MRNKRVERNPSMFLRDDGRPEVYALPEDATGLICFVCDSRGFMFRRHTGKDCYLSSPANTPGGQAAYVCHEHIPDSTVIFDPRTNTCRDKSGQNTWQEKEDPDAKPIPTH